ncbi:hypothetical protein B0T14DRAFT_524097 [Immersiella caudata]|uniref:Uncharacterized protein n=1 Tax=Immersiella caudata TaxID=314043 RepID=A0AA40BX93_9PEZI|nr:hypothetical protein B0T14DRAFT_524097 [Immersiella caudata]
MAPKSDHNNTHLAVLNGHVYLAPLLISTTARPRKGRPATRLIPRGVSSRFPSSIFLFSNQPS